MGPAAIIGDRTVHHRDTEITEVAASRGGAMVGTRAILIACIVLFSTASLFARDPLSVGSAVAKPGQKVTGWIDVPKGSDDGTKIPVTIAHGASDGPILALI